MLSENSKRQNISEGESSAAVDMISDLPDFVLAQILNFLPTTKQAVATSIVSKRWRYVWTYVDQLRFYNSTCLVKVNKDFIQYVNNVLKLHQGNIRDFTLVGYHFGCNVDVIRWINTAISRGVERLCLDISFEHMTPKWPISVFSSNTLVDLKIWSSRGISMDIPTTPIFPCLKRLELRYCDDEFIECIVSRCSALEHLIVTLNGAAFDIVSSSMKRLELHSYYSGPTDSKIVFSVPSLQYLHFVCEVPIEIIVEEELSSLVEADIHFCEPRPRSYSRNVTAKQIRDSFVKFIQTTSNVKSLRIRSRCNKFFNSVGHGLFVNLTKLEIISLYFEWKLLLSVMESSVNLADITLEKTSIFKKHKLAWKEPKNVPTCLSSSLKKISIKGYSEDELPMLKYVLRYAQILEQVDIECSKCYGDIKGWKSDMLQNLQMLHRACERCEFILVRDYFGRCYKLVFNCQTGMNN